MWPLLPQLQKPLQGAWGPLSLDLAQCMKQTALAGECWSQLAQGWAVLLEEVRCQLGILQL